MIPLKLTLSGFLSYRDPVEVDFTPFNLACISGANGAGKSSLLDAITWVLFGQARKRDDSVINMQSETAQVRLEFEYEGNHYRVTRAKTKDKTTVLEFHILSSGENGWKPLTERTLRGTEARIEEILHLDYETFVNASFFLQGNADQFTQQRPSDRKRILSSILGLEVWETYRKATFERRRGVENEIAQLEGGLQEVNNELAEEDERIARLKEVQANLATYSQALAAQTNYLDEIRQKASLLNERKQLVDTLAMQAERTRQELETLQTRLTARQEEKETYGDLLARADEIKKGYQAWQDTRAELTQWEETAARFNEQEKRRHDPLTTIETERTRLETEQKSLQERAQTLENAAESAHAQQEKIKTLEAETAQLNQSLAERDQLEEKRQQVIQQQAEAKAENPLLKAEMDELMQRIQQLKTTEGANCPLCGQPLSPEERARLIEELELEGKQKGDKYRANVKLLQTVTDQVNELTAQIGTYAQVETELRETTRLLDQATDQVKTFEAEQTAWEQEGALRLKEIETALKEKNFALDARATLAEIDQELKEIGYDAANHDVIRAREAELQQIEVPHRQLENAHAALAPLEREIKEIGEQIEKVSASLAEQEETHLQAAAKLAADQAEAPDILSAEREMLNLQEQENKARMALGMAQQNVQVLDTLKQRKKQIEAEREEMAHKVAELKVLERAFGKNGVPAMLIEQALPQIENSANEILERLSGGTMSIRFITQKEYKDSSRDDLRETLEIQISDTAGMRDYEMYSGGEAFRINFAIRLALSEILAQRAGARLQTLVVDEGFGSQDEIGRQRLIEAINTVKDDFEKILVITHIDELKDAFPTRIEVTKGLRGSEVQVL